MDVLRAGMAVEQRILAGEYGRSGDRFVSVRQLSEEIPCSYVTAVKTAQWLCSRFVITRCGQNCYVTTGRCGRDSALEQALKKTRRRCFGFIVNSANNDFYGSITTLMQQLLQPLGYHLVVMSNASDKQTELSQLQLGLEMGLSGVFFMPHARFSNQKRYEYYPLPVVAIGRDLSKFSRHTVTVNNYSVGVLAAQHLLEMGYERFIYAAVETGRTVTDMRMAGFADCLREHGVAFSEDSVWYVSGDNVANLVEQRESELRSLSRRTGIFCYHDLIAMSLLHMCVKNGVPVPGQVGIVGCDDLPVAHIMSPALSTIHYPYGRICETAVQLMLQELEEGCAGRRRVSIEPRLIHRETT